MKTIEFDVRTGSELKKLQIVSPSGSGNIYHILIDKFFQGQMVYQNGEWKAYLNDRSILTLEDILLVEEIIVKSE